MTRRGFLWTVSDEWAVVASAVWSRRTLARWAESDARLHGFGDLNEVIAAVADTGDQQRSVEVCWALLELVGDEELATRTLLQALMPSLRVFVVEVVVPVKKSVESSFDSEGDELEQILLSSASRAITEAANTTSRWPIADLVRKTRRLTFAALDADRRWHQHNTVGFDEQSSGDVPPRSSIEDLAEVLAEVVAMGQITAAERDMIWQTRVVGFEAAEVAASFGYRPDTFLRHRLRVEKRIIANAASLMAA